MVHIFIIISQMFARIPDCTGLQTESGFAGSRINLLDARFPTHPAWSTTTSCVRGTSAESCHAELSGTRPLHTASAESDNATPRVFITASRTHDHDWDFVINFY